MQKLQVLELFAALFISAITSAPLRMLLPPIARGLSLEQLDEWDKEVIPITVDEKEAKLVEAYNALEGWDHW